VLALIESVVLISSLVHESLRVNRPMRTVDSTDKEVG
jgi:hypothetical protein